MTDVTEIEAADDAFFTALNAMFEGDVKPMEALWSHADDVAYLGPVPGLFDIGWKVTDVDWAAQAHEHLGGSIKLIKRHLVVTDQLAVVHHIAEPHNQGGVEQTTMRGTNVFRKEDGVWKLIAHHSDPLPYVGVF